ncbi:hypothetical protein D3C75_696880 [compost metagenome]
MHLKYSFTAFHIRTVNRNLTVKTSWTKQCRIKYISAVSRRYNNNAFVTTESIHLNQQLVKRLFTLVMSATKTGTTLTTHSINFINEDNTWSILLSILEQITYPRSTDTHEHFHKVRTGNTKERNASFTCYRTGKQCFTCSRRTYKQYALRNTCADSCKFAWIFQELNDFDKLLLLFVRPCNILKADFLLLFII